MKIILFILLSTQLHASGLDVIYGTDDRYEANDFPNEIFQNKARSIAIKVSNKKLKQNETDSDLLDFIKIPLSKKVENLCEEERFSNQYALGDCTGFLISKNRILTAGHCIQSDLDCQRASWIFDYKNDTEVIEKKNVFKCSKIISQSFNYTDKSVSDYAIIELDRDTNRAPLSYRKNGIPRLGTDLVLIGHPYGLPLKIADNATIKFFNDEELKDIKNSILLHRDYFLANTDSFKGNSGSPVFNARTGKVEGILIGGDEDFEFNEYKGCFISKRKSNSHRTAAENVLRITRIPELQ